MNEKQIELILHSLSGVLVSVKHYWDAKTRRLNIESNILEESSKERGEVSKVGQQKQAETPEEYRNLPREGQGRFAAQARAAGARD